jgi:hypothetical protein
MQRSGCYVVSVIADGGFGLNGTYHRQTVLAMAPLDCPRRQDFADPNKNWDTEEADGMQQWANARWGMWP